jgi:hypothetical protein
MDEGIKIHRLRIYVEFDGFALGYLDDGKIRR